VVHRDVVTGEVGIATGDGILVLERVSLEGTDEGKPALILRSMRDRLGE
jgi:hypothetical protein